MMTDKAIYPLNDATCKVERYNELLNWYLNHKVRGPISTLEGLLNLIDKSSLSGDLQLTLGLVQSQILQVDINLAILINYNTYGKQLIDEVAIRDSVILKLIRDEE